jgi:tetratricopeptide (TPR) repeat protein
MRRLAISAFLLLVAACDRQPEPPPTPAAPLSGGPDAQLRLVDASASSGLVFTHYAAVTGEFFIPEEMGPGVALFDADGDGDLDAYLVQGGRLAGRGEPAPNRLFRNAGDGTFTDATEQSGAGDEAYGMGVAAADFDNDGDTDLFVTNVGPDVLLANDGTGRFMDVTAAAGVAGGTEMSSSAVFVDYDRDGWLDLYVAVYMPWSVGIEQRCVDNSGNRDYYNPVVYPPGRDRLYRNQGDGTFVEISGEAGISAHPGYGLGVVAADFDDDGRVDIFVANDHQANFLWLNRGDGAFREAGLESGTAYNGAGQPEAGMGIICEDLDDDADFDLIITHFFGETNTLYRNDGDYFMDATQATRLGAFGVPDTSFGTFLADLDHDGRRELFIANGSVMRVKEPRDPANPYAERNRLLRLEHDGRFRDVTDHAGPGLELVRMSRGSAIGDIDGDGDVDVLIANNRGPATLLRNDSTHRGAWLLVDPRPADGPRDALGARVTVEAAQRTHYRRVAAHDSYMTSRDPRVHVGLGDASVVNRVRIDWPSGRSEAWENIAVNQVAVLVEGTGQAVRPHAPLKPEERDDNPVVAEGGARLPPETAQRVVAGLNEIDRLVAAGRFTEAKRAGEQVVGILREAGGVDSPRLALLIERYGDLIATVDGPDEAILYLRQELDWYEQAGGRLHPGTGQLARALAVMLHKANRGQEARPYYSMAADSLEAQYGSESPNVVPLLREWAAAETASGDRPGALVPLERAARIARKTPGAQEQLAGLVVQIARHYDALRDYTRAAENFQEGYELLVAQYGPNHDEALICLSEMGSAIAANGDVAQGEEMVRRALDGFMQTYGADHLLTATTRRNLAAILATRGLLDEAAAEYGAALAIYRAELAPDHPSTKMIEDNLQRLEASRRP